MLTAFDNEYNPIDDPRYGRLVFGYRKWGFTDDGDIYNDQEYINSHYCSQEELGLSEDRSQSRFMPINRDHIGNLKAYRKKYQCPDDQLIGTRGNFDSDSGKTLFV